jgi:hypothetical protein
MWGPRLQHLNLGRQIATQPQNPGREAVSPSPGLCHSSFCSSPNGAVQHFPEFCELYHSSEFSNLKSGCRNPCILAGGQECGGLGTPLELAYDEGQCYGGQSPCPVGSSTNPGGLVSPNRVDMDQAPRTQEDRTYSSVSRGAPLM